jgi:N-acetylmuramoyl-L-alanine amidase|tara:strand:+ start:28193 stop:29512 length:1320 start_codon:yes stop_codon:yes gene_type:complete
VIALSVFISLALQAKDIESLRIIESTDKTQVVFEFSEDLEYKATYLERDGELDRLLLEFQTNFSYRPTEVLTGSSIYSFYVGENNIYSAKLFSGSGNISEIRLGKNPDDNLRIVFDLKSSSAYTINLIDQAESKRLLLNIEDYELKSTELRDIIIAIDAGHGGRDPGATGPSGHNEKDVVLSIAKLLAKNFSMQEGISPFLIRDADNFVVLTDRTRMALEAKADLYISLHADAFSDSRVSGATVYVLSEKGASDEKIQALTNRENSSSLFGCSDCKDEDVISVLLDMAHETAIPTSIKVSEYIIRELNGITKVRKKEPQGAPFRVLKSSGIPSILVELGYISNPDEERRLIDPFFQKIFADAIYFGVIEYFIDSPVAGTIFVSNPPNLIRNDKTHIISEGETLSEIAEFYKVGLSRLRIANNISSDLIYIGQVLVIPGI